MLIWLLIVGGSIAIGIAAAVLLKFKYPALAAAAAAWLLLLACMLFNEYVLPYRGGGASMWPIAQLFGGTVAAVVAGVSCMVTRAMRS